jgi:hypothetical protein
LETSPIEAKHFDEINRCSPELSSIKADVSVFSLIIENVPADRDNCACLDTFGDTL